MLSLPSQREREVLITTRTPGAFEGRKGKQFLGKRELGATSYPSHPPSPLPRPGSRPGALTLLLQAGLVADGGPQLQAGAVGQGAGLSAHHHAQARLLEDVAVVVVGVAHGPAAQVALGLLLVAAVDEAHVAVGPLTEVVEVGRLLGGRTKGKDGRADQAPAGHITLFIFPKHIRIKTGSF